MATDKAPLAAEETASVAAVAANAALTTPVAVAPRAGVITGVKYIPTSVLTGANVESRTLSLYNRGQTGAGAVLVATRAFVAGVNAPANDETALTLSATPANLVVVEGDVLDWESLNVGATGLADPGGRVTVEFSRV